MGENVSNSLQTLFEKFERFITTKTVIGEPVNIGDVIIVPLVDVVFGVGAGLSDKENSDKAANDSGGGGLGARITPSAVLVVVNGTVQLVNVKGQDSVNKLIDMVPGILSKFNLDGIFNKDKANTSANANSATGASANAGTGPDVVYEA